MVFDCHSSLIRRRIRVMCIRALYADVGEVRGDSHARLDNVMTAVGVAQGRFIGYLPKYSY